MDGKKASNRGLVATIVALSVALVVVIGLVVGIIIVQNNQPSEPEVTFSDITANVSKMSMEDAIIYLDGQLKESKDHNWTNRILVLKAKVYGAADEMSKAINTMDKVDFSYLNDVEKIDAYSALSIFYIKIGDVEKYEFYNEVIEEIKGESGYMGMGE